MTRSAGSLAKIYAHAEGLDNVEITTEDADNLQNYFEHALARLEVTTDCLRAVVEVLLQIGLDPDTQIICDLRNVTSGWSEDDARQAIHDNLEADFPGITQFAGNIFDG